ncbi:XRE family transcriptional regulator [Pseudomonas sp. PB103]|uniref:XRE family transcriptional regulator n=1 Tax=Pseudomonas sp. PB103 TaxID=2494698 RepID=UPI00131D0186|nr:XRE family transcriptional regulator [Pseudomonas sp. PB103]
MIGIEESTGNVYQDLGLGQAGEMQIKAGYMAELTSLSEFAGMSESETARRLEIPLERFQQIRRGKFRDLPATTVADYSRKIGLYR